MRGKLYFGTFTTIYLLDMDAILLKSRHRPEAQTVLEENVAMQKVTGKVTKALARVMRSQSVRAAEIIQTRRAKQEIQKECKDNNCCLKERFVKCIALCCLRGDSCN